MTELHLGQTIEIGESKIKVVRVEGNKVKIAIDAPKDVQVRYEKRNSSTSQNSHSKSQE